MKMEINPNLIYNLKIQLWDLKGVAIAQLNKLITMALIHQDKRIKFKWTKLLRKISLLLDREPIIEAILELVDIQQAIYLMVLIVQMGQTVEII